MNLPSSKQATVRQALKRERNPALVAKELGLSRACVSDIKWRVGNGKLDRCLGCGQLLPPDKTFCNDRCEKAYADRTNPVNYDRILPSRKPCSRRHKADIPPVWRTRDNQLAGYIALFVDVEATRFIDHGYAPPPGLAKAVVEELAAEGFLGFSREIA